MTITVDAWAASVDGQYIDKDGYGYPVWQCHDVWLDYLVRVAGGSQYMGYAPTDFTDSVFTHFPVNGVDAVFTKHYGTAGIRKGDVVFWAYGSPYYPSSHVAVALAAPANGFVYTMTQNPGATHRETLPLAGALGYLRPNNIPDTGEDDLTPEQAQQLSAIHAALTTLPKRTADEVLNRPFDRKGGTQTGEVSLGGIVGWIDSQFEKIPDKVFKRRFNRKGGTQTGDVSLEDVVSWIDSQFENIRNKFTS